MTDSLKTFGLNPGLEAVLFVGFDRTVEQVPGIKRARNNMWQVDEQLAEIVTAAERVELAQLRGLANVERIHQLYKIRGAAEALDEITTTIATKGI